MQHLNIGMGFSVRNLVQESLQFFDPANDPQMFVSNNLQCKILVKLNTENLSLFVRRITEQFKN